MSQTMTEAEATDILDSFGDESENESNEESEENESENESNEESEESEESEEDEPEESEEDEPEDEPEEEDEPEDESEDEPEPKSEKKLEDLPWEYKLYRKRKAKLEQAERDFELRVTALEQASQTLKSDRDIVVSLLSKIQKGELSEAWDQIVELGKADPLKAFEGLTRAKISKKPDALEEYKKEVAKKEEAARLREAQLARVHNMEADHEKVAQFIQGNKELKFASKLKREKLDDLIEDVIKFAYSSETRLKTLTVKDLAVAVDKHLAEMYNTMVSDEKSPEAKGPSAKTPAAKAKKRKPPSREDGAEPPKTRVLTEEERLAKMDRILRKMAED